MKKPLPIGISDFKKIIDGGYAYVDKTLFIQEIIEKGIHVALIPRMRRFGKTLNLSMLRYFFEKQKENTGYLFQNFAIWKYEKYRVMQGQFPVIFISLKDIKYASWQETFEGMQDVVAREFQRHRYVLEDETLFSEEKEEYFKIVRKEASLSLLTTSLYLLTEWLYRYHKKTVIVLIDEYDTPAHAAYIGGYYDMSISFLCNWLSSGLKDNTHLEFGVLTGILRIAKESIFSGVNNLQTCTVLDDEFQDKFGLVESEVEMLLSVYGLSENLPELCKWYDGYQIGTCKGIYNPWSVLSCIYKNGAIAPYWVNTSDNALMKQLITKGTDELKLGIAELLQGGIVEKNIQEGIVFPELEKNPDAIWSLLLFSGYVTIDAHPSYGTPCRLRIPNNEVAELYRIMVLDWFKVSIQESKYHLLLNSLISGDIEIFSEIFQEFLLASMSVFDIPFDESEKIYHAFILGVLIGLKERYEVISNRESGLGRYDVMLIPKNLNELGIIMEFKKMSSFKKVDLEVLADSVLKQIEEKQYAAELLNRGIRSILYIGFAFEGKRVLIRHRFRDENMGSIY